MNEKLLDEYIIAEYIKRVSDEENDRLSLYKKLSATFSLIPVQRNSKRTAERGWVKSCRKQRQFTEADFIEISADGELNVLNAGVLTGPASGVIVLDIDNPEGFDAFCFDHGIEHPLPDTFTVQSGGKSPHYYYVYPEDGYEYGGTHTYAFDVLGTGNYAMAPGSIHPETGRPYTIKMDAPIAEAPAWVLDLVRRQKSLAQEERPVDARPKPTMTESIPQAETGETLEEFTKRIEELGGSCYQIMDGLAKQNPFGSQASMNLDALVVVLSALLLSKFLRS